ncbi:MAG: class I SAM-dependent methyltransferase [Desulfonatronovibrio sp.]
MNFTINLGNSASNPPCPLCFGTTQPFFSNKDRDYYICGICALVFVSLKHHLSPEEEKKRYLEHNNDPEDLRYQRFLWPVARAVLQNHSPPARGLDFGCGTGSPLASMLEKHCLNMDVYDPFFAPDAKVLEKKYDFITCTEVVEHMSVPRKDILRIWNMLKPGGGLYIKTQFRIPGHDFAGWSYTRDNTHITFYAEETMKWLAAFFSADITLPGKGVTVLRKKSQENQS